MYSIESFHQSLCKQPEGREPYLNALLALTKLTPAQIHAFTGDMIWMEW